MEVDAETGQGKRAVVHYTTGAQAVEVETREAVLAAMWQVALADGLEGTELPISGSETKTLFIRQPEVLEFVLSMPLE